MAGFGCARRLCSSPAAWFNRNGVVSCAFSTTTDPTKQAPINIDPNQVGVGGLGPSRKGWENWELFELWMSKNNKNYESKNEKFLRFKIFCKTKKRCVMMNTQYNTGCTFWLNGFADKTSDELYSCKRDSNIHLTSTRKEDLKE